MSAPGTPSIRLGLAARLRRIAAHAEALAEALAVALPADADAERETRIARLIEYCDEELSRVASACGFGRGP